jgi:5-methylcytosine-specific restriction endonuclease McrA
MRVLCAELKRRKHAVVARPAERGFAPPSSAKSAETSRSTAGPGSARESKPEAESEHPHAECGQQSEVEPEHPQPDAKSAQSQVTSAYTRRRGRHVPAAVRRAVFERDERRCTYTDALGRRCAETHRLELHHLRAFARGGEHTADNLTLRCHAHNALAAEQDFGREFIEPTRDASEHEPWAACWVWLTLRDCLMLLQPKSGATAPVSRPPRSWQHS